MFGVLLPPITRLLEIQPPDHRFDKSPDRQTVDDGLNDLFA